MKTDLANVGITVETLSSKLSSVQPFDNKIITIFDSIVNLFEIQFKNKLRFSLSRNITKKLFKLLLIFRSIEV